MHDPLDDPVLGRVTWNDQRKYWDFDAGPVAGRPIPASYDPADLRLEVVDAEGKGIAVAVPAYDIERVMAIVDAVDLLLLFCMNQKIAFLVDGLEALRGADVAFAIRRVLEQLAIFAEVFFGETDRTERFYDE